MHSSHEEASCKEYEVMKIKYKEFDKLPKTTETKDRIIKLLIKNPMRENILSNCLRIGSEQFKQRINELQSDGTIRYINADEEIPYIGLTKEYREKLKNKG